MIKHKNSVQIVDNIINSYNHMLRALSMLIGKKFFPENEEQFNNWFINNEKVIIKNRNKLSNY